VPEFGDHDQVLPAGEDLVHRRELTRQADRLPHPRRLRQDVESVDARRAVIRLEQGGENPHDRGLAGAVGAEQREDASTRHVEVHALQHLQFPKGLLQSMDLDGETVLDGGHRAAADRGACPAAGVCPGTGPATESRRAPRRPGLDVQVLDRWPVG
jgi:hypothetical protein